MSGKAATTVAGLAVTKANYDEAIQLLCQRFGKKQTIIDAHIQGLIGIPAAPGGTKLRETFDASERHIRGLNALGITADAYGIVIAPILLSKFPQDVQYMVSRGHESELWDLTRIRELLLGEIEARERGDINSFRQLKIGIGVKDNRPPPTLPQQVTTTGALLNTTKECVCPFCDEQHFATHCPLTVIERYERSKKVRSKRLCYVCLRGNHTSWSCRYHRKCKCGKRHHFSLCNTPHVLRQNAAHNSAHNSTSHFKTQTKAQRPNNPTNWQLNPQAHQFDPKTNNAATTTIQAALTTQKSVLMQIAHVTVANGQKHQQSKIIFDSAGQRTFITNDLVQKLKAKSMGSETLSIAAFGNTAVESKEYPTVKIGIKCLDSSFTQVVAVVVPEIICTLSQATITSDLLQRLEGMPLANPPEFQSCSVDIEMLIGLDYYWDFVQGPVIRIPNGPAAISSTLGWLLSGTIYSDENTSSSCASLLIGSTFPENLDDQLKKFWDLETLGISVDTEPDQEDKEVLASFENSITYENERYFVDFPWKQNTKNHLPDNRELALARYRSLIKRLNQNPENLRRYNEVIQEQLRRGFIERVDESQDSGGTVHYISHHPVFKEASTTTKI